MTEHAAADAAVEAVPDDVTVATDAIATDATAAGGDAVADADANADAATDGHAFRLSLANFDGPFDLLLTLIGNHSLDITEISLAAVTDEFIAYLKGLDGPDELESASEFIVVAATLLDMKIAGLLPHGEVVDGEEVALLEARDLLFARLLQYRAFKQAAAWMHERMVIEEQRHPRAVRLDERYRAKAPELDWRTSLDDFAALALLAFTPRELPTVGFDHLHAPLVSIREQAAVLVAKLKGGAATFRELIAGAEHRGVIVARFLAVLELYRLQAIGFEQLEPLGELHLRWTAAHWSDESLASLGASYG